MSDYVTGWLLSGLLTLAGMAFSVLAWRFYTLRGVVVISIQEMGELMVLLARYNELERPEEQVARLLQMTPEEAKLEIERGRLMYLIGCKASGILESLKASIPDARKLLKPIESDLRR